jgi:hypothetical protein
VLCCAVLCCVVLCCVVLRCVVLCCTAKQCTLLYCPKLVAALFFLTSLHLFIISPLTSSRLFSITASPFSEIDREDLAVQMRKRIGDYSRVVYLLRNGTGERWKLFVGVCGCVCACVCECVPFRNGFSE